MHTRLLALLRKDMTQRYVQVLLNQDMSFFDTYGNNGDIVSQVLSDVLLIRSALSEKVGNYIHDMSTFFGGLVIGFINCWQIALITLATGSFMVAAGKISNIFFLKLAENIQDAYAEAASIAEQGASAFHPASIAKMKMEDDEQMKMEGDSHERETHHWRQRRLWSEMKSLLKQQSKDAEGTEMEGGRHEREIGTTEGNPNYMGQTFIGELSLIEYGGLNLIELGEAHYLLSEENLEGLHYGIWAGLPHIFYLGCNL